MKTSIVLQDMEINPQRLVELLNKTLNNDNIQIKLLGVEKKDGETAIHLDTALIKPIPFSELTSQGYKPGMVQSVPEDELIGTPSTKLHFYHIAMLIDSLTYVLDQLDSMMKLSNKPGATYSVETVWGHHKGHTTWRFKAKMPEYDPSLDPAFLRRDTDPVTEYKGVPIYPDRETMYNKLSEAVDKALAKGTLKPADIPDLETEILVITRAMDLYEGVTVPETLEHERPYFRAWLKKEYDNIDEIYPDMDDEELDTIHDQLMEWLNSVDPSSQEFKEFLEMWKKELRKDIEWAMKTYGKYFIVTKDTDDAGFPYGLASYLRFKPYTPKIKDEDIRSLTQGRTPPPATPISA